MSSGATIVKTGVLTNNQYMAVHHWVKYHLGTPKLCDACGSTTAKRYDWANISGEYKRDLSDWRRLCRFCHVMEKNPGHCHKGHEFIPENIYTRPNGLRECRICKSEANKAYKAKRKVVV